ncbi:hypothetical protein NDU88_005480 [Pleurodeles waltl]|uniref:Uncharacterized protein n=1 Tax=Pleurodeles waltl TaxID=8319 RepID=A0AAV7LL93_PLEWA|nr:hypothetical protein NDU88_005480 [Pleurodeles waltl]
MSHSQPGPLLVELSPRHRRYCKNERREEHTPLESMGRPRWVPVPIAVRAAGCYRTSGCQARETATQTPGNIAAHPGPSRIAVCIDRNSLGLQLGSCFLLLRFPSLGRPQRQEGPSEGSSCDCPEEPSPSSGSVGSCSASPRWAPHASNVVPVHRVLHCLSEAAVVSCPKWWCLPVSRGL